MLPRQSRRFRLAVIALVGVAVIPLVVLAAVAAFTLQQQRERAIEGQELAVAQAAALQTRLWIEDHINTVRSVTVGPAIRNPADYAFTRSYLQSLVRENPSWVGVGISGSDGWNIVSSELEPRTFNASDRAYFQQVMTGGGQVVSDAIINRRDNRPTVVVAGAVNFVNGERGIFIVTLSLQALETTLQREGRSIYLADRTGGGVVYPGEDEAVTVPTLLEVPGVRRALGGEQGVARLEWSGAERLVAFAPVERLGWGLSLMQPSEAAFAGLAGEQLVLSSALVGLVLVVLGGAALLATLLSRAYEGEAIANEQALDAIRQRDTFLAGAAHDLKTPIAAVQLATQVLERRARRGDLDPDWVGGQAAQIQRGTRRMTRLIEDMLDTARLEHGQSLELRRSETDLTQLVQDVLETMQNQANGHELRLAANGHPVTGEWDEHRLTRVIENLIGNAVKYSRPGTRVDVEVSDSGGHAVLAVRDQGPGIPAEDQQRIFSVYERGRDTSQQGSGLGLFITQRLVELHGGRLELESTPGTGSTFRVVLPRQPAGNGPGGPSARAGA